MFVFLVKKFCFGLLHIQNILLSPTPDFLQFYIGGTVFGHNLTNQAYRHCAAGHFSFCWNKIRREIRKLWSILCHIHRRSIFLQFYTGSTVFGHNLTNQAYRHCAASHFSFCWNKIRPEIRKLWSILCHIQGSRSAGKLYRHFMQFRRIKQTSA